MRKPSFLLKNKKKIILIFLIALFIVPFFFFFGKEKYIVIHPIQGPITEAVYGLGKVKSIYRYDVIIGVLSTVKNVFVDEGENVNQGKPLIQLQDGGVFRAPFTGTVTFVKYKVGEVALPQIPILRIEDLTNCYIELSLEQEAAMRVQKGQRAKVSFESIRNKILEGEVSAIFPREDEFLAHIRVDKLEKGVLPGMTADVSIEIGTVPDALLLPAKVIKNNYVFVKRDGRWVKEKIEIGRVDATHVQILGNKLKVDDEIRLQKGR